MSNDLHDNDRDKVVIILTRQINGFMKNESSKFEKEVKKSERMRIYSIVNIIMLAPSYNWLMRLSCGTLVYS